MKNMEFKTEELISLLEAINEKFSKFIETYHLTITTSEDLEKKECVYINISRKTDFPDYFNATMKDHELYDVDGVKHLNDTEQAVIYNLCKEIERKNKEYRECKREILFNEIISI